MKAILLLVLIILLSGCVSVGPLVPVKQMDKIPLEQKRKILSLPIYNESQLFNKSYMIINIVEGISCKNKTWDPAATKTDAINQAKYWAYEMGVDALMNIKCEYPRGTTTTYNCWESITCTAQAIKLSK